MSFFRLSGKNIFNFFCRVFSAKTCVQFDETGGYTTWMMNVKSVK